MKFCAVILLAVLICIVYAPTVSLPFVQDDYTFINLYRTGDTGAIAKQTFGIHRYFYRPLSRLYLWGMYLAFGENPAPFHVVCLLVHFITCVLIIRLFSYLSGDELVGFAVGYIYAFAGAIHIECFIWAVGAGELICLMLFIWAVLLYIRRRYWASAVVYLAASLFKDSAIVLPFILVFIVRRQIWRHLIFFAVLLIPKVIGKSQLTLPPDAPYYMSLFGWHAVHIFTAYVSWLSQAFNPFGFLALLSALVFAWNRHKPLVAWLLLVLLPVLFMPNHVYRYYMITALPVLCFVFADAVCRWLGRRALVLATIVILLFSFSYIQYVLGGVPIRGGTNNLIQKIERGR